MARSEPKVSQPKIWWSNAVFFVLVHVSALVGVGYFYPPNAVSKYTLFLCFLTWQLADFGVTIGYHRLYSHRAFRASTGVRLVLAILGSAAFQGSIKWWCLRHRLHHRFTDDPVHDPYAATKGLFYSHMGWIFYKPNYSRMEQVDRKDLESDPVVRFQHKHYVSLALIFGFVAPTLLGALWGDPMGSFVWAGLFARLLIWHATFCVNSLAHWDGLQPYSDEDTSRGNLLLALLTGGEGNHNFHAFPHDYRSGPSRLDWDPSKWIIFVLHNLGLATGLRRARESDMSEALAYMNHKHHHGAAFEEEAEAWDGPEWTTSLAVDHLRKHTACCLVLIDDFIVDATPYLGEHPGGAKLLREYSLRTKNGEDEPEWPDASWAFHGGHNNHSRAATRRMKEMRIAKFVF